MEKTLRQQLNTFFVQSWPLIVAVVMYLCFTLPALADPDHQLKNLEPYPDGLLYALGAQSLSQGNSLGLHYQQTSLNLWVQPVYPMFLSVVYLLWQAPPAFYLVNVILGLTTLVLLNAVLNTFTIPRSAVFFGLSLYLSHAWVWWLPSLPMTENIILPLFLAGIYGLLRKNQNKTLFLTLFSFGFLFLTRYSVILTTLTGVVLLLSLVGYRASRPAKFAGGLIFILLVAMIYGVMIGQGRDPLLLVVDTFQSILVGDHFWGLRYLWPNLQFYLKSLIGFPQYWLWWSLPFTSVGVTLSAAVGFWLYRKSHLIEVASLALLGASIYPLLLVFYQADLRYSVLILPILVIGVTLAVSKTWHTRPLWGLLLMAVILLFQLPQLSIFKNILSNNLLHRSTAWQYRAIQAFDQFAVQQSGEVMIITALPPHLVDAYQIEPYRVLPLSPAQEFLQKKQFVWGSDVHYEDLLAGYRQWLEEGKVLYISNAYVTHQQSVIDDYEAYKKHFKLELVVEGCQQACNVYQLKLKE